MLATNERADKVKQVYSDLNRKFEEEETQRKAKQQNLPYINLYGFPVDTEVLSLLTKKQAESYEVVTFYKDANLVKLAVLSFGNHLKPILQQLADQKYKVEIYLISQSSFKSIFETYSRMNFSEHHEDSIKLISSDPRFSQISIKNLGSSLNEESATHLIEVLLGSALVMDASDIHLEPEKNYLKIRFRIDGVLQDAASLSMKVHHQLISRLKILSKMKLNIVTAPQDGSFSLTYDTKQVDVRASVLPTSFGESVTLRILRQDKSSLKFEDLGITGLARERILAQIQKPNGMLLTTGPTGSGKTTTLYAILNRLNEPGVKIITLEDPVEYKIEGITQTPIDARTGVTFASALRSVLRQDPDIVMVGEMRDLETAETGCQAALTGHIVLSTLHTNDAAGALPRLLDLGVKPFVLAPAINAVIAQRLVRKICQNCKQEYELPQNLQSRVEMILKSISQKAKVEIPKNLVFYHSTGCDKCQNLGYKGRMGIYEVFTISESIEKLISTGSSTSEIKNQAIAEGMMTMAQDGILKALQGITDVEEVFRVTEE
jgi:type II secretory ATPase GspE/PulE/Tfp pilus assembly ATPase PilB-like protein